MVVCVDGLCECVGFVVEICEIEVGICDVGL